MRHFKGHLYWVSLLVLTVFTFETGLQTTLDWLPRALAEGSPATLPASSPNSPDPQLAGALETALGNPLLTPDFVENFPYSIQIGPTDPLLDQDPFFLHAQNWNAGTAPKGDLFEATPNGVRVGLPGMDRFWELQAPLDPLLATDDFLFFTARDSKLISDKTPGDSDENLDSNGGGVFVVATADLISAYAHSEAVPVFFFPLLGDAWDVGVRAAEAPVLNAIQFVDAGDEAVMIKTADIASVVAAERKNLEAAQMQTAFYRVLELRRNPRFAQTLRDSAARSQELILALEDQSKAGDALTAPEAKELEQIFLKIAASAADTDHDFVYPGRGATAGFGVLFTGYDLDRGDTSPLVTQRQQSFLKSFASALTRFLEPESARADSGNDDPAQMMRQLYSSTHRLVAIFAYLFIFSVAARYAVKPVRERLRQVSDARDQREMETALREARAKAEKIARRRARKMGVPYAPPTEEEIHAFVKLRDYDGIWHRYFRREKRAIFNNFTYALTSLRQLETQTTHAVVGTAMDRFFAKYTAAPNKILRRLFNGTIVHRSKVYANVSVNDHTLFDAIVIAGIDTGLYAWQLYDMVPGIDRAIGTVLSPLFPGAPQIIAHSLQNPHLDLNRNYEIGKSLQGGAVGGAADLVSSTRDLYTQRYLGPVRDQMIREGLDPFDSRNAVEMRRRLDEAVDREVKVLGWPGRDEKGWDLLSIYGAIKNFVGYDAPAELRTAESADGQKIERLFFGKQRPGLPYPVLQASLKYAREAVQAEPGNVDAQDGLRMLQSVNKDFGILRSLLGAGFKAITFRGGVIQEATRFRRARQALILLTAAGDDIRPLMAVLDQWKGTVSEGGALWAARIYSSQFIQTMTGNKTRLLPTLEERTRFGAEAESKALLDLNFIYPNDAAQGLDARQTHSAAFEQFKEQHVIEAAKAAEEAEKARTEKFRYERLGWFGRWQKARIAKRARLKFLQKHGYAFDAQALAELPDDAGKKEARQQWQQIYAMEYARGVGLQPDFAANPALQNSVVGMTDLLTTSEVSGSAGSQAFRNELRDLVDQGKFDAYEDLRATQYAKNFVRVYEDMAENVSQEILPAMDPARPGLFQGVRQRDALRAHNPLSKTATTCLRILEAGVYPTHELGANALLDRAFPGYYSFKMSMMSELRALPVKIGPEYLMLNTFYDNPISFKYWTLGRLTMGWTFRMGNFINMRAFKNIGRPLVGKFRNVVIGATFYSLATFWGAVIQQPITDWWDESAWDKLGGWWNTATWPVRWGGKMVKCHVLGGNCGQEPSEKPLPRTNAEKVHDVVQNPQDDTGENTPDGGSMGRMWEDDGSGSGALNWAPAN